MDWLDSSSPGISVNSDNVHFIHTPEEFYNTLLSRIRNAKDRIYLSSLYLGTGKLERELVDELENALTQNASLKVQLLFDYLRGTRGSKNSTLELVGSKKIRRLDAYFFHTHNLRGYLKQYLPERINEIVGLQHMKFYIFDGAIILSGANLSDTYFTNRQDRYIIIEDCPQLIDFFVSVFETVASCSIKLVADGELEICPTIEEFPFYGDVELFCANFKTKIDDALRKLDASEPSTLKANSTVIYPLLQMSPFKVQQEKTFVDRLLRYQNDDIRVSFATGYFNFDDDYAEAMLQASRSPIDILMASPQANGFYGAHGILDNVPALYVYLSRLFYQRIQSARKPISLFEYNRPDWTFHAKGIWIEPKEENSWAATVVGSSNYGYRSTFRDLESQVLIVTSNKQLMKRISEEKNNLMEHMIKVDAGTFQRPDHFVPVWVRFVARFFRSFF